MAWSEYEHHETSAAFTTFLSTCGESETDRGNSSTVSHDTASHGVAEATPVSNMSITALMPYVSRQPATVSALLTELKYSNRGGHAAYGEGIPVFAELPGVP
jgi:hypothetical protein